MSRPDPAVIQSLAVAAGSIQRERHKPGRNQAAYELLNAIVDLVRESNFGQVGVKVLIPEEADGSIEIGFVGNAAIRIAYSEHDGMFRFYRRSLQLPVTQKLEEVGKPFSMEFDPLAKAFVTCEPDPWIVPAPGERVPEVTPAAKLIGAALAALQEVKADVGAA